MNVPGSPSFGTPAETGDRHGGCISGVMGPFPRLRTIICPGGMTPAFEHVSLGVRSLEYLEGVPPAAVFTAGFDPLRDVGVEYSHQLECAGNTVQWHHYAEMTHGWLQMMSWS